MTWNPTVGEPLDVAFGVDVYRDATAVVRALSTRDAEGAHAVMTGTDAPRHVALALAAMAIHACRLARLDADGINRFLADVTAAATDFLLDEAPVLPTTGEVHGA